METFFIFLLSSLLSYLQMKASGWATPKPFLGHFGGCQTVPKPALKENHKTLASNTFGVYLATQANTLSAISSLNKIGR